MYNPSLREQPIEEPAAVIPVQQESSILDWLEASGRLLARDDQDFGGYLDENDEEITDLMGGDEIGYDDIDDDDDDLLDLDEV